MNAITEIREREEVLDRLLPPFRLPVRLDKQLMAAAENWSAAIWTLAESSGATTPDPEFIKAGLLMARRPVFICGVHRSGTTLVRDLLDGHPQLSVLPSEGSFLTSLRSKIESLPSHEKMRVLGCEWVRRLANPINQPPYWLLGRTTNGHSPYVSFARSLMGWWSIAEDQFGAKSSLWPHIAIALAYASSVSYPEKKQTMQSWAEKTPTHEFHVRQLWAELPTAKIIHVVRNPVSVYASRKRLEVQTFGRFTSARSVRDQLGRSLRLAANYLGRTRRPSYFVVRYEDVIHQPRRTMEQLAAFLGIEMHPVLFRPTVAHRAAYANSSFRRFGEAGTIFADTGNTTEDVTDAEIERVAASVGEAAVKLGYG